LFLPPIPLSSQKAITGFECFDTFKVAGSLSVLKTSPEIEFSMERLSLSMIILN
jgi:hypothetical protein